MFTIEKMHTFLKWFIGNGNKKFLPLQICNDVYDSLLSGEFGPIGVNNAENYRQNCQRLFPYATKFNLQHHMNNNGNKEKADQAAETEQIEP